MGWKEVAAIKKKYALLRTAELAFRNALRKESESDWKQRRKDSQDQHLGDLHMIEEAYGQKLAELKDQELAEIQAAN